METLKNNKKEKVEMIKKAEEVNRKNTALTTQVSDLKEDLHTKDALLKMARD